MSSAQLTRKMQVLGYVLAPLFLALQLWFLAFVVQLCALLFGNEVALGAMFRLSVVARFAILADTAARSFWLGTMPASSVTKEMLSVVPWSFAGLFMRPEEYAQPFLCVRRGDQSCGARLVLDHGRRPGAGRQDDNGAIRGRRRWNLARRAAHELRSEIVPDAIACAALSRGPLNPSMLRLVES